MRFVRFMIPPVSSDGVNLFDIIVSPYGEVTFSKHEKRNFRRGSGPSIVLFCKTLLLWSILKFLPFFMLNARKPILSSEFTQTSKSVLGDNLEETAQHSVVNADVIKEITIELVETREVSGEASSRLLHKEEMANTAVYCDMTAKET